MSKEHQIPNLFSQIRSYDAKYRPVKMSSDVIRRKYDTVTRKYTKNWEMVEHLMLNNFQRKKRRLEGNQGLLVPITLGLKTRESSTPNVRLTEEINKKVTFSEANFPKG